MRLFKPAGLLNGGPGVFPTFFRFVMIYKSRENLACGSQKLAAAFVSY
jgi:hypothetical protein